MEIVPKPEITPQQPLLFVPELDAFGRHVRADGTNIRLHPDQEFSGFLEFRESGNQTKISLIRPDDTDQTASGNTFFFYGDHESGRVYIKSASGKFGIPKATLTISQGSQTAPVLSFQPEKAPDYLTEDKKRLQPLGLIWKDATGQYVIARKYVMQTDLDAKNTVSYIPVRFELSYPDAAAKKGALKLIQEFNTERTAEQHQHNNIKSLKEEALVTALRLAHKNRRLPGELKPVVGYDKETKTYKVVLYLSKSARNLITGSSFSETDLQDRQIGDDFAFGTRLIFRADNQDRGEAGGKVTGMFIMSSYDDKNVRHDRVFVENVTIDKCSDKILTQDVRDDQIGDPVYEIVLSSKHPDDLINTLTGIDRGLKPRYYHEGERPA